MMEECLASDLSAVGFYGRPVNFMHGNVSTSLVASDTLSPSPPLLSIMAPVMTGQKRSKRKHEHIESYQVENCLVQLCRGNRWMDVVNRCRDFPEEACPVRLSHDVSRKDDVFHRRLIKHPSSDQFGRGSGTSSIPLFHETALGIACASNFIGKVEGKEAIIALLRESPSQVIVSQYIPGHTPLREAILNGCCTVEIFRFLLDAAFTCRGADLAFYQKDKNGQTLMDHLVISVQLGSSPDSVSMLREFLRIRRSVNNVSTLKENTSPLIRLLTMGNTFNLSDSPMKAHSFSRKSQGKTMDSDTHRLHRVLYATRILLDDDPGLLYKSSSVTNCTPLHVVLRNFGNFPPLVQELLDRDKDNRMVKARNCYGDLPLHVACSVGVPYDVLALVVKKTARVATDTNSVTVNNTQNDSRHKCDSLVWSLNKSGYAPVDLEWICHIESGVGLYTSRPFSRSDASAFKQHCFKQDGYYRDLLRESVDEVTGRRDPSSTNNNHKSRKEEAEIVFGGLLDRIALLIHGTNSTAQTKFEKSNLCTPYSARLPLPILELFLWLRPNEVMEKDPYGFLAIHHALRYGTTGLGHSSSSAERLSFNDIDDWKSFVFQLLSTSSKQCEIQSGEGRLPLHYALDHSLTCSNETAFPPTSDATCQRIEAHQLSWHSIIERLIDLYPESVDQKDPVTGLYPFMMAAQDKSLSLDTIYFLLRRSPSRTLSLTKTQKI